jgi:hypothetical protein
MSLSYSIDHVVTSTESVNVEVAAKSEMTLVATDNDAKSGDVVSTYVLASGDTAFPGTVSYRVGNQSRGGAPVRRISITFSTWAAETDSVSGAIVRKPANFTVSMNLPADMTLELADINQALGNLFSFLYASVSAGARNTGYLQKLLYGSPQVV